MVKNGEILLVESDTNLENVKETFDISTSNLSKDPDSLKIHLISIDDDEETILEFENEDQLDDWYDILVIVGHRWGPIKQLELEHEIAGMRKTIGSLYEFMAQGSEIPNSNKRIENLTCDIEIKDSKLADLGALIGTYINRTVQNSLPQNPSPKIKNVQSYARQ